MSPHSSTHGAANPAAPSRRSFMAGAIAATAATAGGPAQAQSFDFKPNQRYPDPSVQVLDPSFAKYRLFSSTVEQIATGFRWVEGPVWVGDGRYLLFSDIPNNRIIRWDEATGQTGVFRHPANFSNGLARDRPHAAVLTLHADAARAGKTGAHHPCIALAMRTQPCKGIGVTSRDDSREIGDVRARGGCLDFHARFHDQAAASCVMAFA